MDRTCTLPVPYTFGLFLSTIRRKFGLRMLFPSPPSIQHHFGHILQTPQGKIYPCAFYTTTLHSCRPATWRTTSHRFTAGLIVFPFINTAPQTRRCRICRYTTYRALETHLLRFPFTDVINCTIKEDKINAFLKRRWINVINYKFTKLLNCSNSVVPPFPELDGFYRSFSAFYLAFYQPCAMGKNAALVKEARLEWTISAKTIPEMDLLVNCQPKLFQKWTCFHQQATM